MSPFTITINDQTIVRLSDDETCPIAEEDLFKSVKNKKMISEVKNSKFYLPNYDKDLIQSLVYSCKQYFEFNVLQYIDDYLPEKAIIIDIGANIGNHTLYWANESGASKIYAFEPIPHSFKILKKNVEINNLKDRTVLYNFGLADKICDAEIKCFCYQNYGGTRLKVLQSNTKNVIPLKTLDSLNITEDRIDLIKIDVEGMDSEVLLGAADTIEKYKPLIAIESFDDTFERSNSILEDLGYQKKHEFGNAEYFYVYDGKKRKKRKKIKTDYAKSES